MKNLFINLCLCFVKLTGIIPALIFMKPKIHKQVGATRHLPKPCIVVSNHKSLLDFVLLLIIFPFRTIRFLMAEVLYNKSKFFAFFLNSIGGIKVDRDNKDFSFVGDSLEVLDNKGTIGIFPQARLPIPGKTWPFTTSTAFIAMHCDAPIVPVYTDGNYGLFKRASVCIGEPIYLNSYQQEGLMETEQIEHLTRVLEEKVMGLENLINKNEV